MGEPESGAALPPVRRVTAVLGVMQILGWGSTFYLLAVLARPIAAETGWSHDRILAGISLALLVAGLVSPRVGRAIDRHGGRPVLAAGAVLTALGLALIGAATGYAGYLAGWGLIGLGMGAGLYDAAFATLGVIYGQKARGPISAVTLFGGFASTVCWPVSAWLVAEVGWRGACFAYAGAYLALALPLLVAGLPRRTRAMPHGEIPAAAAGARLSGDERISFVILAAVLTVAAVILSVVGTHLVTLLQARGLTLAQAVALGMIIGPASVGARLVETIAGRHYHPLWTLAAACLLMAAGLPLFFGAAGLFPLAIACYAAGTGIGSIARGTVPLALFGTARYAVLNGRLGLPILVAMAIAPIGGALIYERASADGVFAALAALAALNLLLVMLLLASKRRLKAG